MTCSRPLPSPVNDDCDRCLSKTLPVCRSQTQSSPQTCHLDSPLAFHLRNALLGNPSRTERIPGKGVDGCPCVAVTDTFDRELRVRCDGVGKCGHIFRKQAGVASDDLAAFPAHPRHRVEGDGSARIQDGEVEQLLIARRPEVAQREHVARRASVHSTERPLSVRGFSRVFDAGGGLRGTFAKHRVLPDNCVLGKSRWLHTCLARGEGRSCTARQVATDDQS